MLHAHDAIQLSRCCRAMNKLLTGPRVKSALRPVVFRDLGAVYKVTPLVYLGKSRNVVPVEYPDGMMRYGAHRCAACSHLLSERDRYDAVIASKRALCMYCIDPEFHADFDHIRDEVLRKCRKLYKETSIPRIERLIERRRYRVGEYIINGQFFDRDDRKSDPARELLKAISLLDVDKRLILRLDRELVKAVQAQVDHEKQCEREFFKIGKKRQMSSEETFFDAIEFHLNDI